MLEKTKESMGKGSQWRKTVVEGLKEKVAVD